VWKTSNHEQSASSSFLILGLGVLLTVPLFKTGMLRNIIKVLGLVWILTSAYDSLSAMCHP
jgi:hypothetical protein